MDKALWEAVIDFHGHKCPGIAMGFKICEAAIKKMNINIEKDEIKCIAENNTCSVDAVRFIFRCLEENGNLSFKLNDEQTFSFFDEKNNKKLRVKLKNIKRDKDTSREEFTEFLLNSDIEDICLFDEPEYQF